MQFLKSLIDEAHEQASVVLFITAICLEVFTPFDDMATVALILLAMITRFGSKRFRGFNAGAIGAVASHLPKPPKDELSDDE